MQFKKMANTTRFHYCALAILVFLHTATSSNYGPTARRPNIVLILTDDQDYELNSMKMMEKLKTYIGKKGVTFENMFVTTPICCPSRSSIISGRYVHNHRAYNNSIEGGCSDEYWQKEIEPKALPVLLKKAGYTTFYAGKYLNRYGEPKAGGPRVPPGWDSWSGLIGNSYFYNYPMSTNGTREYHGTKLSDYMTNLIKDRALKFFEHSNVHEPFFMMLCPTAPHVPATPIPPHTKEFANLTAPRTPHYDFYSPDKHWLLRQAHHPLSESVKSIVDDLFRKRWRSLQSVDELVQTVVEQLEAKSQLDNTYIFYTSDNGFHLGQFCLPWDKRMPYEFDIRVPLLVRGPNVAEGIQGKRSNVGNGWPALKIRGVMFVEHVINRDRPELGARIGGDVAERKIFWMLRVAARRQVLMPARGYSSKHPKDFAKRHY